MYNLNEMNNVKIHKEPTVAQWTVMDRKEHKILRAVHEFFTAPYTADILNSRCTVK